MLQVIDRNNSAFDAIVVGSGATGGWAAKQLTEAGLRVVLLEAGPGVTPAEFSEHAQPYQLKYGGRRPDIVRDRPIQGLIYACRESNFQWFANDIENPYTMSEGKPFHWIRMRVLGGRTLSWGRQSYRMSDLDFKAASHDGYGDDWPISHAELAPYYERVERYVGISGQAEGLSQLPDGEFLPPMGMSCGEIQLRDAVKSKMGRTVTMGRAAVLTREHNGRAACHYCGPCEQGCVTYSYFSSPFTTIADASKTGKLTLLTGAVASHVTTDRSTGLATGVAYIDRLSRAPRKVRAKLVFLCASTLESTRLLLNSAPAGLANSSGVLGRYLMDHIYHGYAQGEFPALDGKPWFGPPRRPNGIYIPRFRNVDRPLTNGFIRGYGYQGNSFPEFDFGQSGFGESYKKGVRENGKWTVRLHLFAECLARHDNCVEIDPDRRDAWGIPVLKVNMEWSANEKALWNDAREQGGEMIEAAGGKKVEMTGEYSVPGFGIHEIGTARMGNDPKTSVLNRFGQTHDIRNLFVTDGAAFVSSGCQNPTLTMMAITVRACDYAVQQGKRGDLA